MAKRKSERDPEELPDASDKRKQNDDDESGSDEDMDMVNVDFEWFDPQPAVDFHGLKNLLRQLLDVDSQLFNLSELADIILSQPLLGSTVKVDGNETDPYAFLTVLNLETHKDKKVIQDLTTYLSKKSAPIPTLPPLLTSSSPAQIGLILTERFINMPHEIVPPMYTMLLEEIQWAVEEKEPYTFTHYLVLSKCYSEIQSQLPSEDAPPSKKKNKKADVGEETFYFHPEDEVLHKHAVGYTSFEYDTPVDEGASDSKRAFQELGVKPKGHMVLIEADKFKGAVEAVKAFLNGQ
ncbi:Mss4p nuclear export [Alternaria ethzedia]|uniref:Mss4p nuclear export n=1 Tax=Alternaria ethzedia TaxID=181014 RepID=UPI0020C31EF0|nr:Mss4p nuclear export [Alternaria ethzedia]KAI4622801.1 Mss4p nuclear export [Alternaria ethzedia]KAI4709451.1 Mss4p nuclear export [Alternaria sp. Ai002NY15]